VKLSLSNKRTRFILATIVGVLVILGGALITSAITGQSFGILADQLTSSSRSRVELEIVNSGNQGLPGIDVHIYRSDSSESTGFRLMSSKKTNSNGLTVFNGVPIYSPPSSDKNWIFVCYGKDYPASSCRKDEVTNVFIDESTEFYTFILDDDNAPMPGPKPTVWGKVYNKSRVELGNGQYQVFKGGQCSNTGTNYLGGGRVINDQNTLPNGQKNSFWARDLDINQKYCFKFFNFAGYESKEVVKEAKDIPQFQPLYVYLDRSSSPEDNKFTLKGRITENNELLAGAKVEVSYERDGRVIARTESAAEVISGDSGNSNFKIENIPMLDTSNPHTNYYYVKVSKQYYSTQIKPIKDDDLRQPETIQNFQLEYNTDQSRAATIEGTVTKRLNSGIMPSANSIVRILQKGLWGLGTRWYPIDVVRTDENGNYKFEIKDQENNRWERDKRIFAEVVNEGKRFVGNYPSSDSFLAINPADQLKNADIHIDARISGICGTVTAAENGQGLEGATVKVRPKVNSDVTSGSGQLKATATTDAQGKYCINNLRSGNDYEVQARFAGNTDRARRTTVTQYLYVPEYERIKADFSLARNPGCRLGGYVEGFVFDREGNPIRNASVSVSSSKMDTPNTHPTVGSVTTNREGKYHLSLSGKEFTRGTKIHIRVAGKDIANDQDARYRIIIPSCASMYRLDFYINRPDEERWPTRKDVEINLIKRFRDLNGQEKKKAWPDVKVQLVAAVGGRSEASSYSYLTPIKKTNGSGKVVFRDVPKGFTYQVSLTNVDEFYTVEKTDQLEIIPKERRQVIYLGTGSIANKAIWPDIYMYQNNGQKKWGQEHPDDFSRGNTVGSHGCCITSVAMGVKFYYPDSNSNPTKFLKANNNDGLLSKRQGLARIRKYISYIEGLPYNQCRVEAHWVTSWQKINQALKQGYPVVVHTKAGGWDNHGVHCMLVVKHISGNTYQVLDPAPKSGYGKYPKLKGSGLNFGIILKPRNEKMFTTQTEIGSTMLETADSDKTYPIKENSQLVVKTEVNSESLIQPDKALINVKRDNQDTETYSMSFKNGTWQGKVPGFKNNQDFEFDVTIKTNEGYQQNSGKYNVDVVDDQGFAPTIRNITSKTNYSVSNSWAAKLYQRYSNWVKYIRYQYLVKRDQGIASGVVKNVLGKPAKNAKIIIGNRTVKTNSQGYFYARVKTGRYLVKIFKPNSDKRYIITDSNQSDSKALQQVQIRQGKVTLKNLIVK